MSLRVVSWVAKKTVLCPGGKDNAQVGVRTPTIGGVGVRTPIPVVCASGAYTVFDNAPVVATLEIEIYGSPHVFPIPKITNPLR